MATATESKPTTPASTTPHQFAGYITKYGDLSLPLKLPNGKQVYERIMPDAFADSVASINRGDVQILCNVEHNDGALLQIGRTGPGGNVTVENRDDGVFVRVTMLPDTVSQDLYTKIAAGLVNGLSVEFKPADGVEPGYAVDANGDYVRSWSRLNLTGFAVTAGPLYPTATITAVRSRSIPVNEIATIASEIEKIEQAQGRIQLYEYESFLVCH